GNVLLKSSRQDQRGFVVKISDFGLSRVLHGGVPHPHLMATGTNDSSSGGGPNAGAASETDGEFMDGALDGTVPYLAPELINNCQRSKASDVWAYGVLLWQLVTGHRPYDGLMQFQVRALEGFVVCDDYPLEPCSRLWIRTRAGTTLPRSPNLLRRFHQSTHSLPRIANFGWQDFTRTFCVSHYVPLFGTVPFAQCPE
ncbi:hypothetical protein Vretimale_8020, partial [Volvox reticuliferus]